MRAVPVFVKGEVKFDVTWKFQEPAENMYHEFEWLRNIDLEAVGASHSGGVRKIIAGRMSYEATHI
jgi:hypothetical protein